MDKSVTTIATAAASRIHQPMQKSALSSSRHNVQSAEKTTTIRLEQRGSFPREEGMQQQKSIIPCFDIVEALRVDVIASVQAWHWPRLDCHNTPAEFRTPHVFQHR